MNYIATYALKAFLPIYALSIGANVALVTLDGTQNEIDKLLRWLPASQGKSPAKNWKIWIGSKT